MPANSSEYVITRPACSAVSDRGGLAAVYPACSAVSVGGVLAAVYPACSAVPGWGVLAAVYPACSAVSDVRGLAALTNKNEANRLQILAMWRCGPLPTMKRDRPFDLAPSFSKGKVSRK